MTHVKLLSPPGIGETMRDSHRFSQVAKLDNVYETAGQTPLRPDGTIPTTLPLQIEQVFENVQAVLTHAKSMGWPHVFKITSYHVGLNQAHVDEMVRAMRKWMPDRFPIWTMVGVEKLAREGYLVEVEVKAFA